MTDIHFDAYGRLVELLPDLPRLPTGTRAVFRSELGGQDLEIRVLCRRGRHTELHMASLDVKDSLRPPCREIGIELDSEAQVAHPFDYRTGGEPSTVILQRDGTYPVFLIAWLRSIRRRRFELLDVEETFEQAAHAA